MGGKLGKGLKKGLGSKWYVERVLDPGGGEGFRAGTQHGGGQEVLCFPSQSRREPVLQSCVMTQKEGQCLVGAEAE